jgi:hypothetical protein
MVNHNFMEVNEAAIASAIDQQVGSSCVRYIKERLRMALTLIQDLKVVRGHTDWLPYRLEKLRHPCNFGGSKRTVISTEMYLSRL